MVYEGCTIKGPYNGEKGRKVVHIYFPDGRREVTTLARYMMEKKLDKYLDGDQHVDHIDRNFKNEDINNYQVLDMPLHISLDHKRVKNIVTKCVWCKKEFVINGKTFKNRNRRTAGPFCSKKCIGEYGAELQNKRVNTANKNILEKEYFYLEK